MKLRECCTLLDGSSPHSFDAISLSALYLDSVFAKFGFKNEKSSDWRSFINSLHEFQSHLQGVVQSNIAQSYDILIDGTGAESERRLLTMIELVENLEKFESILSCSILKLTSWNLVSIFDPKSGPGANHCAMDHEDLFIKSSLKHLATIKSIFQKVSLEFSTLENNTFNQINDSDRIKQIKTELTLLCNLCDGLLLHINRDPTNSREQSDKKMPETSFKADIKHDDNEQHIISWQDEQQKTPIDSSEDNSTPKETCIFEAQTPKEQLNREQRISGMKMRKENLRIEKLQSDANKKLSSMFVNELQAAIQTRG